MKLIKKFIDTTILGFSFLCKLISRGFYFYIKLPFTILSKIFYRNGFLVKIKYHFKARQEQPIYFLATSLIVLFCSTSILMYNDKQSLNPSKPIFPIGNNSIVEKRKENDTTIEEQLSEKTNIFVRYSNMDIDFIKLKEINNDVFAWLKVDGTNINYPIVQTTDNDYYLENDIEHSKTTEGWPFMDYRNSKMMSDNNTIFYGHNLLNGTNFGSISKVFTKDWFKKSNHLITIIVNSKKYTYEIFSCYETGDEVDYLQNIFYDSDEYDQFLNNIKGKSKYDFKVNVTFEDNIITLSTCKDDNSGRKVIHAKFIKSEYV